jgi:transcriptional regulator with XRE-family HTH domain
MDMGKARTIFTRNPGEAFRLAKRMGVSRSLVSELLSGKREATGFTSRQVVAEIEKRAAELLVDERARLGKPRKKH